MDTLIGLALICAAIYWAFSSGKREGSRKGYGVGRKHERGRRRRY